MPYNEGLLNTFSAPAGADLSGKQFYGVALVNDVANPPGVHAVVGTTLKGIAGVLQNNPLPGQAATIQSHGATPVAISANQAITGGTTFLQLDVGGTFTAFTTGVVVAQAVESCPSSTAIQIITARLTNVATA
jgi:hypothetical protein